MWAGISTENPIDIMAADITIGSKSIPVKDKIPKTPIFYISVN